MTKVKEQTKEIKEQPEEVEEEVEENSRTNLNIQQFFNDMRLLSDQVRDKNVVKPPFAYGSLEVIAYLQWLLLGEIMTLNDKLNEEEE